VAAGLHVPRPSDFGERDNAVVVTLTADMQRVVREQRLGFWATVGGDGRPNLSPKGTTDVWDDGHLWCADICSPHTVANIEHGSWVEINVVDPFVRKGYRFKGAAVVHRPGSIEFADGTARMRAGGSSLVDRVGAIVVVEVDEAEPVISPAYDDGTVSEAEVRALHTARFARLAEAADDGPVL
jgi:predicted pyridoxine 5'-phosphate oxidase superfamily flavin-nucleotide-binding protein